MRSQPLYSFLFTLGAGLLALAVVAGFVYSFKLDQGPPSLRLNDAMEIHLAEIDRMLEAGDVDGAIPQLELAVRLLPAQRELAHNMLGNALSTRGELDRAITHFRRALEIDPEFADAYNNLAVALARRGDLDQALGELRNALSLRPDFQEARVNLERMRERLRRSAASVDSGMASGGDDPVLVLGRQCTGQFYRGELEELHRRFSGELASGMDLEALEALRASVNAQLGLEVRVIREQAAVSGSSTFYVRRARFERHDGEVEVLVQLDDQQQVIGFQFRPAREPGEG